ncbi:MauE/DoxX family redox-associated membrane protein [Nocardiopsis tropica]|uniref:MauE/DoxX family redox-associated membrane protein n=1 Tax=Nocardiopsis tropica TaxID=109330 RepID=UPI003612D33D
MPWDHLLPGAAALLATVFAVSAFGKARDPRGFAASLEPLRPVPAGVLPLATWSVPAAEAAVVAAFGGWALGAEQLGRVAFAGSFALLCVFTVVIVSSLRRGPSARCHCFGRPGAVYAPRHVARNAVLGAVAAAGALAPGPAAAPEPAGVLLAVLAGGVAGVLVVVMDDIVDLFAPAARPRRG